MRKSMSNTDLKAKHEAEAAPPFAFSGMSRHRGIFLLCLQPDCVTIVQDRSLKTAAMEQTLSAPIQPHPLIKSTAWLVALAMLFGVASIGFALIARHYTHELVEFFAYTRGPLVRGETLRVGLPLARGVVARLALHPDRDRLAGVSIQTVTWGDKHASYICQWELRENGIILRSGTFSSGKAKDWAFLPILFEQIPDSKHRSFTLAITAGEAPESNFVGIPFFEKGSTPVEASIAQEQSTMQGIVVPPGLQTAARLLYARDTAQ